MDLGSVVHTVFEQYRSLNETHPLLGAMLTAGVIFPGTDITSQLLADKTVDWKKVRYTAALSPIYGLAAHGCVRSGDLVGEYISEHPLARAALGPNLWGNLFNVFFFVNNCVGEKKNYRFGSLLVHYASVFRPTASGTSISRTIQEKILDYVPRREYFYAFLGTVSFWNAFQYVNYTQISRELQTPSTLAVAFAWTVLLSGWSLAGRRKLKAVVNPLGQQSD